MSVQDERVECIPGPQQGVHVMDANRRDVMTCLAGVLGTATIGKLATADERPCQQQQRRNACHQQPDATRNLLARIHELAQCQGSPTAAGNGHWLRIQRPNIPAHRN